MEVRAPTPTIPPGYRWVVKIGTSPDDDLRAEANAGWCPTLTAAEAEGDQNAATATRVLQMLGVDARYGGVRHLDHNPLPPGVNRLNTV